MPVKVKIKIFLERSLSDQKQESLLSTFYASLRKLRILDRGDRTQLLDF